jgi:hypothetical protein
LDQLDRFVMATGRLGAAPGADWLCRSRLRCLEIQDRVRSTVLAGRLNSHERIADLASSDRCSPDIDMRAALAARLRIALEGGPR